MHQLREAAFTGIVGALSLAAMCGLGCSRAASDVATEAGALLGGDAAGEIMLVSEASVIEAAPNVLHKVQLTIKNVGKRNLKGVSPRLPCRCNIVQPLPAVLPSGSTHKVTMNILSPFAGSLIKDIEFFDEEAQWVGTARIMFRIVGDVPRLAHSAKPVWFRHIAGTSGRYFVEFETVEKAGAADFITGLSVTDSNAVSIGEPTRSTIANIDSEIVLRKYSFPVEVIANEDLNLGLKVRFSDGGIGHTVPMSVQIVPRAHLIPHRLVIATSDAEVGKPRETTFCLVARVPGEVYEVESFDRDLLSIRQDDTSDRQQWIVGAARTDVTATTTTVILVSDSGDRKELLVLIE